MTTTSRTGHLIAVGDVAPCRADPDSIFASTRDALNSGDLLFGQLETNITSRGARAPHAKLAMRADEANGQAIADAGFDVMSFAGNHCFDWGDEGFFDTLETMGRHDVALCGAGFTLAGARAPVFMNCGEIIIAFLAYSSILPDGYAARGMRPGCAPMRAHTTYEMIEPDQPGTKPRILTSPHREDLKNLREDIIRAREEADLVIVSFHWGIHITPIEIADYQIDVAHAAIDAGANAILGHHPHILKGVEFYKGAPIFYSMGNFAIEQPQAFDPHIVRTESFKHLLSLHPDKPAEGIYVLPDDTRMTYIVSLHLTQDGVARTEILPAWINDDSVPLLLSPDDERFEKVRTYTEEISKAVGFLTKAPRSGDRVVLETA